MQAEHALQGTHAEMLNGVSVHQDLCADDSLLTTTSEVLKIVKYFILE